MTLDPSADYIYCQTCANKWSTDDPDGYYFEGLKWMGSPVLTDSFESVDSVVSLTVDRQGQTFVPSVLERLYATRCLIRVNPGSTGSMKMRIYDVTTPSDINTAVPNETILAESRPVDIEDITTDDPIVPTVVWTEFLYSGGFTLANRVYAVALIPSFTSGGGSFYYYSLPGHSGRYFRGVGWTEQVSKEMTFQAYTRTTGPGSIGDYERPSNMVSISFCPRCDVRELRGRPTRYPGIDESRFYTGDKHEKGDEKKGSPGNADVVNTPKERNE